METIPERGHVTHKGACSGAGSFPHQRETFDAKDNIRVVSIFNGARTASEVIHQAAVKKSSTKTRMHDGNSRRTFDRAATDLYTVSVGYTFLLFPKKEAFIL